MPPSEPVSVMINGSVQVSFKFTPRDQPVAGYLGLMQQTDPRLKSSYQSGYEGER